LLLISLSPPFHFLEAGTPPPSTSTRQSVCLIFLILLFACACLRNMFYSSGFLDRRHQTLSPMTPTKFPSCAVFFRGFFFFSFASHLRTWGLLLSHGLIAGSSVFLRISESRLTTLARPPSVAFSFRAFPKLDFFFPVESSPFFLSPALRRMLYPPESPARETRQTPQFSEESFIHALTIDLPCWVRCVCSLQSAVYSPSFLESEPLLLKGSFLIYPPQRLFPHPCIFPRAFKTMRGHPSFFLHSRDLTVRICFRRQI